ncbi:MAG: hypothetical protein QGH42_10760, partial [Kiritimatiellia bacterium]|nr:hypothetical protein [Kiritimatiellia bacterium]
VVLIDYRLLDLLDAQVPGSDEGRRTHHHHTCFPPWLMSFTSIDNKTRPWTSGTCSMNINEI